MSFTENIWIIGDTPRLPAVLTDANGEGVDAADLTLKIKPPSGDLITIANPVRTAVGTYHHDQLVDKKGTWYYRWESTQPFPAVAEGSFTVQPSRFVS